MINLAQRSKMIRNKFGLNSQQELADILGCSIGKIKGFEQGTTQKFKPADMKILKERFGLNQEWLEHGEGEMMPSQSELLLRDIDSMESAISSDIDFAYIKNNKNVQELIALLPYASSAFIEKTILKLQEFKSLTEE